MKIHNIEVRGKPIDSETRCEHYQSEKDRIAIKFNCCNTYYPCIRCHEETAEHPVTRWEEHEFGEKAILCGACGEEITIKEYLQVESHCPCCRAKWNPNCSLHQHYYFQLD
ncbi:hypothetical protein CR194_18795 [Salipaludibacillus keqinensis]|uniref:CHY-type domain-containing protein n=1 Tax=Salipaludibacillus keqinensis TaxID=2045207 RepID=A0A323T589_9BACI|nr:CHY zinc finger protein [Salipaludibacillus keqinensis]PYZ91678.1 hypothetical protein CR194_18795 [Salipaludibacillus keqinensis]